MSEKQRVRKILNWLIFSEFAENDTNLAIKLGYTKSSFSQIVNGKVPLSDKFINSLCSCDKNINKVWILTGTGEMLRNTENQPLQSVTTPQIEKNNEKDNYIIELQKKTIERLEIDLQKCCEEKKALQTGNNVFNK